MNKEFTDDYRDICRLLTAARTLEETESAIYYAVAMCDQLHFETDGLEMKDGTLSNPLPLLIEALWLGYADAMRASAVRIDSWRVFAIRNGNGRLLAVRLLDTAPISRYETVSVETDFSRQLARISDAHTAAAQYAHRPCRII